MGQSIDQSNGSASNRSNRRSDESDSSRLRDGSEIMDQVINQWAFEGAKDHIAIQHLFTIMQIKCTT